MDELTGVGPMVGGVSVPEIGGEAQKTARKRGRREKIKPVPQIIGPDRMADVVAGIAAEGKEELAAWAALTYLTGARISETLGLWVEGEEGGRVGIFELADGRQMVRLVTLKNRTKHYREVPLVTLSLGTLSETDARISKHFLRWLNKRKKGGAGDTVPLFPGLAGSLKEGSNSWTGRIKVFKALRETILAGLTAEKGKRQIVRDFPLHPHYLRAARLTHLGMAGVGPLYLQLWAGHSNLSSLSRYVRAEDTALRRL